jgi:hypothetical protein
MCLWEEEGNTKFIRGGWKGIENEGKKKKKKSKEEEDD